MSAIKFVRSVRTSALLKSQYHDLLVDNYFQVWESFRANSGLEPRYVCHVFLSIPLHSDW
jgi:hypothetical protein